MGRGGRGDKLQSLHIEGNGAAVASYSKVLCVMELPHYGTAKNQTESFDKWVNYGCCLGSELVLGWTSRDGGEDWGERAGEDK